MAVLLDALLNPGVYRTLTCNTMDPLKVCVIAHAFHTL